MRSTLLNMGLCRARFGKDLISAFSDFRSPHEAAAIIGHRMKKKVQL